ncbi:glutamate synthase [Phyllobacterium brassicacearum]|uniref:Chaperone NapD n=1 Tax=Phyllobacterium brassicacearum TaxID=314235 RepID=A0A2P7B6B9_9HYPH|nr:chaperone NapD [Phyllobacterium brassicacearum]PSH62008.1 glutamate synthase [Phyllobacterium brassicacearum]TDQ14910.1 periplasmic nitrate reductase chaperone NapD [Phyllobacterium brassicacearum]
MRDKGQTYHISSAVIMTLPAMQDAVLTRLREMANVEVHAHQGNKIVVVIEGISTGILGDRLSQISALEGVMAANMVFEHVETEETGSNDRTDAA